MLPWRGDGSATPAGVCRSGRVCCGNGRAAAQPLPLGRPAEPAEGRIVVTLPFFSKPPLHDMTLTVE